MDVAKEAAEIVLLEKDLEVLERGVREGRATFANTMKYVFMATSANFGNMFSMAGVSLFLPFLPLLPKQVLLTNLLTDLPEMTIAGDRVDPEMVDRPRRWDVGFICRFMIVFGVLSSAFDFLTFGMLLWLLRAGPATFRTGWFVESVVSASSIVLMIRTRRGFLQSHPGRSLLIATLLVVGLTASLPYSPLAPSSASSRSRPSSSTHWGWSCSSTWARPRRPRTSSYRREGLRSSSASTANGSGRDDPPAIWSAGPSHSSASRFRDW